MGEACFNSTKKSFLNNKTRKKLYTHATLLVPKKLKYKNILVTYGEKLSVLIYSELLKKVNLDNNLVWSEFLIKTNNNYREAFPLLDKSVDCFKKCKSLLNKNIVITTGYVTESIEGFKTTLGRNGSDFTATIIASISGNQAYKREKRCPIEER